LPDVARQFPLLAPVKQFVCLFLILIMVIKSNKFLSKIV
jgi:hypothetical protein